jgi:hypothetical protein
MPSCGRSPDSLLQMGPEVLNGNLPKGMGSSPKTGLSACRQPDLLVYSGHIEPVEAMSA